MEKQGASRGKRGRTLDGRSALLEAACRSIARKGLRGLRVEQVAADAGVAPSLIYYHFGDRATLLRVACEYVGERAATYTTADDAASGRQALVASLTAEIQDEPDIRENSAAWGEFRDLAVFDESLRPAFFRATDRWVGDIAGLVRRGQEDGSIAAELDPEAVAIHLTALTEGMSTRWLSGFLSTERAQTELRAAAERSLGALPD
jgi:AcrR family transcriptional regulator